MREFKFWVLSSLFLFNFGCAQNSMVAKTDMPEDDVVATAPAVDAPKHNKILVCLPP